MLLAEMLILLALFFRCLGKEELQGIYYGEDMAEAVQDPSATQIETEPMRLPAGVYRVHVQTNMDGQEETLGVCVENGRGYTNSLKANAVTILPGNDAIDFDFFLTDTAYEVYLKIDYGKTSLDHLQEISVWKTRGGERILLFTALMIFLGIDMLLVFRRRCLEGKVSTERQMAVVSLCALALIQFIPYCNDTMIFDVDVPYHLLRIESLANAMRTGEAFPYRITSYWLDGHGYASSLFYCDFFLMIPALLRVIGFPIMTAYKMFMFIVMAATGVITYAALQRCVRKEYAALLGTAVYVLAPYRFNNFYIRGAVGEYLAMTFVPMVFCGFYLLCTEDIASESYKKCKWWIVFGMSAILECHLLTTEMVALCLAVFCVIFVKQVLRKRTFVQLAEATGIVLLWNCWFYVPMLYMMNKDTYKLQQIIGKNLSHGMELASSVVIWQNGKQITSRDGIYGREPYSIGVAVLLLIVFWLICGCKRKEVVDRTGIVLAVACVFTNLLNSNFFPWEQVQKIPGVGMVVSSMQFPFRWLGISVAFGAAFVAYASAKILETASWNGKLGIVALLLMSLAGSSYQLSQIVFTDNETQLYTAANMGTISLILGEYLITDELDMAFSYHDPAAEDPVQWYDYEKQGTNITITVENSSEQEHRLELPLQGYQGYRAVDAGGAEIEIAEERGAHGDLTLRIPAEYEGTISVAYVGFPIFKTAEGITLFSVLISAGYLIYRCSKGRKRAETNESYV